MSAQAFNRIAALEAAVRALTARLDEIEKQLKKPQACEEQPHTLTLRKKA